MVPRFSFLLSLEISFLYLALSFLSLALPFLSLALSFLSLALSFLLIRISETREAKPLVFHSRLMQAVF